MNETKWKVIVGNVCGEEENVFDSEEEAQEWADDFAERNFSCIIYDKPDVSNTIFINNQFDVSS